MHVAVGSGNPVKVAAAESALAPLDTVVESVPVDSGVSEQPVGTPETVAGAETRAERALAAGGYDLGVGIEGGVAEVPGAEGLFLVMWAAVTDGESTGRGGGPTVRLPAAVAERVRGGEELGPVMDDAFDRENVAENRGAAGLLTGGGLDRERALADAVAGALGPFATDAYER